MTYDCMSAPMPDPAPELNDHRSRAHALLSASSSNRWLNCPPSAVAAEAYPQQDTEYTKEGTQAHEVAEYVARGGNAWTDLQVPGEMIECAEAYRDYIQEHKTEDGATVLLEQRVDFSPWVPDGFGTADCIIVQGKTVTVIDYKYGKGVAVDAKENTQMMLYGLGALNLLGDLFEIDTVEMHIFQPRINNVSDWTASAKDLLYWAEKTVKRIAADAIKGKGKPRAGDWCKFCPHAGKCRTLTKLCTEYVEANGARVAVPVLAPHEIAEILEHEAMISLWLKRVKEQALTTMLNGGEIPGHKVVEGKPGNRKWTDEQQVAAALDAAGVSRGDYTETKLLSPAGLDKAIGKKQVEALLTPYIERAPGAPTIVPITDKRPAYDRVAEAAKDFS